ncbi:MAG: hypothetical protein EBS59_08050 [Verrucomicrobia bacterium]|nr:hypothetical protein [Verrucomicrobiota bacterium]
MRWAALFLKAKGVKAHPAGQLIVMGVPGPELTDGLRDLIRRVQPGGFIFFTRNMAEAGQFQRLVRDCEGQCLALCLRSSLPAPSPHCQPV